MKLFDRFYKNYIDIYEKDYSNVSFKIENNQFNHYFLVKGIPYKITLNFLADKSKEVKK